MGQNGEPIINQLTFDERGEIIQRRRDPWISGAGKSGQLYVTEWNENIFSHHIQK